MAVPRHATEILTEPEWTSFDIARQTLEVAGIADPSGAAAEAAAYLHPVCNTEDADRSRGDYCYRHSDGRGVGNIPIACNPAVPDRQAGLCYTPCPEGYNGVGPVCWTERATSKPRGAGVIPDQSPPDAPVFDAGLCYSNCPNPEYAGIGPVCWGGCGGRYPERCGVGCATTTLSCGLVTTEMVVAPLEMLASIASLGGCSLVDKAKDSAKVAFKNAVEEATEASVKDIGVTIGQQGAPARRNQRPAAGRHLQVLERNRQGVDRDGPAVYGEGAQHRQ